MLANNFKKSLLAVNVSIALGAGFSGVVVAEESQSQNQVQENVEVIEVRGIRASNKENLNGKRFANAVVDVVTAEDVGKFPDGDVGESLARISGVSVSRQFGQGQQVSIRGASAQLTRTLLDGHSVASTSWFDQQAVDRSFNYSLLPSELVGGLEVYKSSQANLVEGGIGGTVIVKTRKPLDLDANTVFASVKADYGTVSEETDPEFSGLYSWKNEDENFGILVSGALAEIQYQRNGIESSGGWSGGMAPTVFQQERDRTAINVAMQYRPTDSLLFGLNVTSLELGANNANSQIIIFPGDGSCTKTNASGNCTFRDIDGTATAFYQSWVRKASMKSDTIDLDWQYEAENFTFKGRVGNTSADSDVTTANYGEWTVNDSSELNGTVDMTGDITRYNLAKQSFDSGILPSVIGPQTWAPEYNPDSDEETYLNLDFDFPVDFGLISAIKTGFRYADHKVVQDGNGANVNVALRPMRNASEYYPSTISAGGGFIIPEPNMDLMIADSLAMTEGYTQRPQAYGTVEEENMALYAMAEFSGEGVRGNVGIRYISTDIESDYYDLSDTGQYDTTLSTDKADYSEFLPSLNLVIDVADDIILRTSAAQVISRPNYADLFATRSLAGYTDNRPLNEVLQTGNVGLSPFKAFQADIGLEWYFSADGMVSLTYYTKDVSSFISTQQQVNQQIGIDIPVYTNNPDAGEPPCGAGITDCWTVSSSTNGSGGSIEGIEFQIQDAFENGFGYSFNYTYADAEAPAENYPDRVGIFSDSSKNTYNLVAFYEQDNFSARLAYNWRSEFIIREAPGWYGNREHKAYGQLDFSATYSATDYLDVTFEAINLTEEDSVQLGNNNPSTTLPNPDLLNNFPVWSFEGEARYKVGVAVRF
ncbi:TonB-dependent receptor [Pseudoalteromonas sp. CO348]|uniref:TonB-dependent receptor n=1 Tax=Pseudoalteromonas TaxID=53246 RepID=UPI001023D463|nr:MULTISPECIES: TonB-dependent receptor [Pseudoalteromonas]MCG7538743.1 TonB-dependent receptor [Pseudoalteromonas sp. OF7H-1]RZG05028.1 TonB-dependent receptor [Pseudoalteromonas sp. CO348]WMO13948.1 TonB-dependent receptor [Pseudoalteromonas piscicida]